MRTKRLPGLLFLLLAAITVTALVVGCGAPSVGAPTAEPAQPAEPTKEAEPAGQEPAAPTALDNVVSLAKRRGFVYPCGEIYGGTKSAWSRIPKDAQAQAVELAEAESARFACPCLVIG